MKTPAKKTENAFDNWIEPESIKIQPYIEIYDGEETVKRPVIHEEDQKALMQDYAAVYFNGCEDQDPAFASKASALKWLTEKSDEQTAEEIFESEFGAGSAYGHTYIVTAKTIGGDDIDLGTQHSEEQIAKLVESLTGPVIALRAAGIIPERIAEQDQTPSI
jgi:hypothetical protein